MPAAVLDELAARIRRQALTVVLAPAPAGAPAGAATAPLLAGLVPRLGRRRGDVRWPPGGGGLPPWRQGRPRGADDSVELVAWFDGWPACVAACALDWCPPLPDDRLLLLVSQAGDGLGAEPSVGSASASAGAAQAEAWLRSLVRQQRHRAALLRWPVHLVLLLPLPASAALQRMQAAGLALAGAVVHPRPGLPAD